MKKMETKNTIIFNTIGFWDGLELFIKHHSYGQEWNSNTILYGEGGKVIAKCNNGFNTTATYRYNGPILSNNTLIRDENQKWKQEAF